MKIRNLILVFLITVLSPAYAQTVAESQKQAIEAYPDLGTKGSAMHTKFIALVNERKQSNPEFFSDAQWPMILAKEAAGADKASPLALPDTAPEILVPAAAQKTQEATPSGKQEKIDVAFGKRLGDTFNTNSAIGKSALTDGTPMYQFSPAKPFRSFTQYFVLITPRTNQIYSIWALGAVANTETGKQEQALIMELLQQKYGATEKQGMFDAMSDSKQITHGNRSVLTKVTGFMDVSLEIRYYDRDIEKIAETERLAIEGKKVDASGL